MESDAELLGRWRQGDTDAGQKLVTRYYRSIDRFFANKVSVEVADLVQETFTRCVQATERLEDQNKFRSYLFSIAYNVLRKYIEGKSRTREIAELEQPSMQELDPSPRSILIEHEEQRLLLAGLRHIPVDLQCALELFYWEQLKVREIAEIMGIPKGTAQTRLHRARKRLDEAMEQLAETPEALASTRSNLDAWAHRCRLAMGRTERRPEDAPL